MALDEFTLEDALQWGTRDLRADHSFILACADLSGQAICSTLSRQMQVRRFFLGGSVLRQTWGAPRLGLDLFVVLDDVHRHYLDLSPAVILDAIAAALRHTHSFTREEGTGRIAVKDTIWQDHRPAHPVSIVVLPALAASRGIMVPDRRRGEWICIDPGGLDPLARAADRSLANWRELTRILKTWNNRDGLFEPYIRPGLLIELMVMTFAQEASACDLGTQLVALFELMFRRFDEDWPDPAGLAPSLGSYMLKGPRSHARQVLEHTWRTLAAAKRLDNSGDLREAKRLARSVLRGTVPIEPRYANGELIPIKLLQKPKFGGPRPGL